MARAAGRPAAVSGVIAHDRSAVSAQAQVASLEKSLPYYRALYGAAAERPRDKNGRVGFEFLKNTRIALEQRRHAGDLALCHQGRTIRSHRVDQALAEVGSAVIPSPDEPDVVRFEDNYGITVELRVAD